MKRILAAGVVVVSASLSVASSADAALQQYIYWQGNPVVGAKMVAQTLPLQENHVRQDGGCQVAAGARTPSNGQYGTFSYGNGYAGQVYDGSSLRAVGYYPGCSLNSSAAAYYNGTGARVASAPDARNTVVELPDGTTTTPAP